jgi:two-component system, response regulator
MNEWDSRAREHRPRIYLLVEDNPEDAFLMEMELTRIPGARLCIVKDGQQAVDYLQGKTPYNDRNEFPLPDLILLDLKMPRLDGFEVLRWLRAHQQDDIAAIPVIIISSSDSKEDVKEAYKLGANFYLTKPLNFAAFSERIRLLGLMWGEYAETLSHA